PAPSPTSPSVSTDGGGGLGGLSRSVSDGISSAIRRFTNVIDIGNAPVALQKANEAAKAFVTDPVGSKVTQTVTTLGVVTSGAGVAGSIFLNPVAASEVVLLPIRIWGLLLSVLGLRKRYKPWGVVYDSITKQPLDPAYVSLLDEQGNEISTVITDINGRYGFLVEKPGTYTIVANKTNYTFPSTRLGGQTSDELYPNLYHSEPITITADNMVIDRNIPLDPVNFDWNEFQKAKQGKFMNFYSRYDRAIARFNTYFFGVGFFISLLALVYAPAPYNLLVFGFYIIVLLLRIFGLTPKTHGAIIEKATGKSLSFALIHIFSTTFNNEISTKVADANGRYYCLLPKGSYIMRIDRKNEDGTYTQVYESGALDVKSGIINENLKV
ncbi:hypothetical protein EB052_02235, partial [bacterium]|nr:hypothetical protein [bacterium]